MARRADTEGETGARGSSYAAPRPAPTFPACTEAEHAPAFQVTQTKETGMTTASGHTSAIRAKKVIGTAVKNPSGKKIGVIEDMVLDKQSNNIMFAVVGFGGFLGVKEKFHPIPWEALDYDETQDGYLVNYSKEQLEAAPAGSIEELTRDDGDFRERTYEYYKAPRTW
jgi:sporulation protein YlmC with PRC-barrel domain